MQTPTSSDRSRLRNTAPGASSPGRFRWRIVALLFLATTVNYVDRQVLSFTMTDELFRKDMLDIPANAVMTREATDRFIVLYGDIDAAFKFAYALGLLAVGWLIDRIGTRRGFALGMGVWSLAALLTAFVTNIGGLSWVRALLGLGESTNFPSSIKTVAEWFPRRERTFASGLFNAGTNVGIIIAAFLVPYLILHFGWRSSFLLTGALSFVLLGAWWFLYRKPDQSRGLSERELAYIRSDREIQPYVRIPWGQLLGYKQTWAFAIGKFLADPIWWFYVTWLPYFFNSSDVLDRRLDLSSFGIPFLIIYVVSDAGSVFFGWLSTQLMRRGWSANRARKTTLLICALCVVPIVFVARTNNLTVAIALLSLATAAHQGWSATMYTFASDLFPRNMVASVTGIGGMFGAVGGILLSLLAGRIIRSFGYEPMFIIAGGSYLLALVLIHVVLPTLRPLRSDEIQRITQWPLVGRA